MSVKLPIDMIRILDVYWYKDLHFSSLEVAQAFINQIVKEKQEAKVGEAKNLINKKNEDVYKWR